MQRKDVIRVGVLVHAAEFGAVLEGVLAGAAHVVAECARTLDADVDLLVMARLTPRLAEGVVLRSVYLVNTGRRPLGQVGIPGRALVELAPAGGKVVTEVGGVERLIAIKAGPDGGVPGIPSLVKYVIAAELDVARIKQGILTLVVETRRGVAGWSGYPTVGGGAGASAVAGRSNWTPGVLSWKE